MLEERRVFAGGLQLRDGGAATHGKVESDLSSRMYTMVSCRSVEGDELQPVQAAHLLA